MIRVRIPLDTLGRTYRVVYDAGAHYPFEWVLMIPVAMFCIGRTMHAWRLFIGAAEERGRGHGPRAPGPRLMC
jgi:hypothetical protein